MLTWLDLFFNTYDFNNIDDDDDVSNNIIKEKRVGLKIDYGTFNDLKIISENNQISVDEIITYIYCLYINIYLLHN